jgi:hypothetical protein
MPSLGVSSLNLAALSLGMARPFFVPNFRELRKDGFCALNFAFWALPFFRRLEGASICARKPEDARPAKLRNFAN